MSSLLYLNFVTPRTTAYCKLINVATFDCNSYIKQYINKSADFHIRSGSQEAGFHGFDPSFPKCDVNHVPFPTTENVLPFPD